MAQIDVTTYNGLLAVLTSDRGKHGFTELGEFDGTFCPACGDRRRMDVQRLRGRPTVNEPWVDVPGLFVATCVQCKRTVTLLLYRAPSGFDVVALPSSYGGLSTPSTPAPVAYYLDQAQRSQAVGARSAAVSMYRSALEQLLFHEGYERGMLNAKIEALLANPSPPQWRDGLEPEYLQVIKDLGNAAIHPNDGDVEKQAVLEAKVLQEVGALFAELLDRIYEQPAKKAARLAGLRQVVDSFTAPAADSGDESA